MIITSAANPRLKQVREALSSGQGDAQGRVPIEGIKLMQEALRSRLRIEELFVARSRLGETSIERLLRQIRGQKTKVFEVGDRAFLSISDTASPQGILGLAKLPQADFDDLIKGSPMLLIAFELQDPGNLGTLIRSAEAFGVTAVLLTSKSVSPLNPKVIRSSAGSIFRVPCFSRLEISQVADTLLRHGFRLLAASPTASSDFREVSYKGKAALLIGNEARGLEPAVMRCVTAQIRIPMSGTVESLNAAVATSILLCEAARQRAEQNQTANP